MNQDCCIELNSSIAQQRRAILRENDYQTNQQTTGSPNRNQRRGDTSSDEESKAPGFDLKNQRGYTNQINLEDSSSRNFAQNTTLDSSDVRLNMNDSLARGTNNERDRQNPPAVNIELNNMILQAQAEAALPHRPWTVRDEAKSILRRVTEAYLFLIGLYALSIMIMKGALHFYVLFGFVLAVCVIQMIRAILSPNGGFGFPRTQKRAKLFKVLDWLFVVTFLVLATLRLEVIEIPLAPFVAPGMVNAFLCFLFTEPQNSMIRPRTIVFYKLVFWSQMLLIGLKADGVIENWAFVFVALFYTLVFFMSISVGFFILAFSYVCQAYNLEGPDCNIVGLIWDFLNALFSWVWGLTLLGIIEQLRNDEGSTMLVPGLIAGLAHGSLLLIFTLALRKNLISYLASTLQLIIGEFDIEVPSPAFETIKGNIPYLLKVSPTYYMVINEDFRIKDKQHAEGCKTQLKEVKRQRKQSISIPKRVRMEGGVTVDVPENKSATVRMEANSIRARKIANGGVLSSENTPEIKDKKIPSLCYSDDDADVLEQVKKNAEKNQNEETEQTCMICCMNAPNAVFMKCGHSGVCYSCALETWKKGDKCALCRRPIDEILKVSLVNGVNVAKVIEAKKKYPTLNSLDEFED